MQNFFPFKQHMFKCKRMFFAHHKHFTNWKSTIHRICTIFLYLYWFWLYIVQSTRTNFLSLNLKEKNFQQFEEQTKKNTQRKSAKIFYFPKIETKNWMNEFVFNSRKKKCLHFEQFVEWKFGFMNEWPFWSVFGTHFFLIQFRRFFIACAFLFLILLSMW